jgi:bisanhydrobacterioruberin hydratase
MYLVGAIQYGMHSQSVLLSELTPLFLGTIFIIVSVGVLRETQFDLFELFIFVFLIGLMSEIIGVNTGILFGTYRYTDVLGSAIMKVPVIIAINWAFLIGGGIAISGKLFISKIGQVLFTVFIIVLFDFIMEPVAVKLHYWDWSNNTIPLLNYVTWAGVTLICVWYSQFRNIRVRGTILSHYFIAQTLFFIALRIIL